MTTDTAAPQNRIASLLLFAAAALAPLPFGSTDSYAIAFWCVVLGLAALVVSPRAVRREHLLLLSVIAVVIVAGAFVLHEQLAANPWIASPHPLWKDAAAAVGAAIPASPSIARNQPYFALGAPLANILAIAVGFIVCLDRVRARQLLLVIAWSGAAYAAFGIVTYVFDPMHVLWRDKIAYQDVLTSIFINRNTAAVYFGSCAIVWLLLTAEELRRLLPDGRIRVRRVTRLLLSGPPRSIVISISILVLCLVAMLLTNSRAGIVLSLAGLTAAFAFFFRRDLPRRGGIVGAIVIAGIVALTVMQLLGGKVSGRFDVQGLSDEGRFDTYRATLRMIADYPWFGTGLGTFAWSFPAYRSGNISMWGVWDRAHSTPLELASDLGVPLAVLITLAWLIALGVLINGSLMRRRDLIVPVSAISVAGLALAHSCIDFSLQIPGYSIVVFALAGAGLAQSFSSKSGNGGRQPSSHVTVKRPAKL